MAGGVVDQLDVEGLRAAAAALAAACRHQMRRAAKMTAWLGEDGAERNRHIDRLVDALFTGGRPLAERSLSNAAIREAFPGIVAVQQAAQDALSDMIAAQAAQRCYQLTTALYEFGRAFHGLYDRLKSQRGLLDYDDLIRLTDTMLGQGEAAQWVGWKLDNGIRACCWTRRRTSPAQWRLLRRLSDEFFEEGDDPPLVTKGRARCLSSAISSSRSIPSGGGPGGDGPEQGRSAGARRHASMTWREVGLDVLPLGAAGSRPGNCAVPSCPGSMIRACRSFRTTGEARCRRLRRAVAGR